MANTVDNYPEDIRKYDHDPRSPFYDDSKDGVFGCPNPDCNHEDDLEGWDLNGDVCPQCNEPLPNSDDGPEPEL